MTETVKVIDSDSSLLLLSLIRSKEDVKEFALLTLNRIQDHIAKARKVDVNEEFCVKELSTVLDVTMSDKSFKSLLSEVILSMQAEDIHIEDSFTLSDFFRGKLDLLVCKSVISLEEEDDDFVPLQSRLLYLQETEIHE